MQKLTWTAATALSFAFLTTISASAQPATASPPSAEPAAMQPLRNNVCRALAPAGWTVIDQDARGATYGVASPDHGTIATYGVAAISRAQVDGYHGPQYRRPALFAQYLAETTAGEPIGVTGSRNVDGMTAIDFQSASKHGVALFRSASNPSDPGGYVISVRIAIAEETDDMEVAGEVAESIDCVTLYKTAESAFARIFAKAP